MGKERYHFIRLVRTTTGLSWRTMPGQTFGRNPVPDGVLVKDTSGTKTLAVLKKDASEGKVVYTSSLKKVSGYCTVREAWPLDDTTLLFHEKAQRQYDLLYAGEKEK